MTQEREQIQQLEQRQRRLFGIMEKRVDPSILEPHITRRLGDTFERDLKVGTVNNKLRTSYERINSELSDIQVRLDVVQGEELVSEAQAYLDELAVRNAQLSQLRRLLTSNDISQDIFDRREAQFRQLEARGQSDSDLKRGIEMIEARKREQEELAREFETETPSSQEPQVIAEPKAELPELARVTRAEAGEASMHTVSVYWRNKIVILDGREISLRRSNVGWAVFMELAKNAHNSVGSDALDETASRVGSLHNNPGSEAIHYLKGVFEGDQNVPSLIVSERDGRRQRYSLDADVEFVGDKPKMQISATSNRVLFEGQVVELRELEVKALRVLARNVDKELFSRDLSLEAYGNANSTETNLARSIRQLKSRLNRNNMPDIIFSGQSAQKSWNVLKGVDVVFEEKEKDEVEDKPKVSAPRRREGKGIYQRVSREFVLPDGKTVSVRGEIRAKFLGLLMNSSEQNQITSGDLAEGLYGNTDQDSKDRLSNLAFLLNSVYLNQAQWEIVQPVSSTERLRGESGRYFLRKVDLGDGEVGAVDEDKGVELTLSDLREIERQVREGVLPEAKLIETRRALGLSDDGEWEIVPLEDRRLETEVEMSGAQADENLRNLEQIEIMVREGILPESLLDEVRGRLGIEVEQPEIAETPVKKQTFREVEFREFELPDGQAVKLTGKLRIEIMELLVSSSEQLPVTFDELTSKLYGADSVENRKKVTGNMNWIRSDFLAGTGWEIIKSGRVSDLNKGGEIIYFLRKSGEEVTEAELDSEIEGPVEDKKDVQPDSAILPEETDSIQPLSPIVPDDKIEQVPEFIPYEPSPEDLRTEEEMTVLKAVLPRIKQPSQEDYSLIHGDLRDLFRSSPQRVRRELDGFYVNRFTAGELNQHFNSVFRKMREEAMSGLLRGNWTDAENQLWEEVRNLIANTAHGDPEEFRRIVNRMINSAEAAYLKGAQSANTWIKLEEEN